MKKKIKFKAVLPKDWGKVNTKGAEEFGEKFEAIKRSPSHCVQCGELMLYGTEGDKFIPICTNPRCPNYGLLQIGEEKMKEVMEK